jgi:hypothetical protein
MPTELTAGTAAGNRLMARIALLLLAISLVCFGFLLVRQVSNYTLDSLMYLRMAQSDSTVPVPYLFRVLVPALASHMHVPAAAGMKIISSVSLVITLWLVALCAMATGARVPGAAAAMIVIFCSRNFLYNFHNPFLTDAPALAVSMAMMLASLVEGSVVFALLGGIGILVRESTVFMVPSILFSRRWKRGILACAFCALVYILPRLILNSSFVAYLHTGRQIGSNLARPWHSVGVLLISWYMAWSLLPFGLLLAPRKHALKLWGTALALGAGWIASSAMATDLDRMSAILTPVIAIGAAHVFDRLFSRSIPLAAGLLAAFLAQLFVLCPDVGRQGTHLLPVIFLSVPAVALLAYSVLSLWPDLVRGYREMTVSVRQAMNPLSPALQPVSDGGDHGRGT